MRRPANLSDGDENGEVEAERQRGVEVEEDAAGCWLARRRVDRHLIGDDERQGDGRGKVVHGRTRESESGAPIEPRGRHSRNLAYLPSRLRFSTIRGMADNYP